MSLITLDPYPLGFYSVAQARNERSSDSNKIFRIIRIAVAVLKDLGLNFAKLIAKAGIWTARVIFGHEFRITGVSTSERAATLQTPIEEEGLQEAADEITEAVATAATPQTPIEEEELQEAADEITEAVTTASTPQTPAEELWELAQMLGMVFIAAVVFVTQMATTEAENRALSYDPDQRDPSSWNRIGMEFLQDLRRFNVF